MTHRITKLTEYTKPEEVDENSGSVLNDMGDFSNGKEKEKSGME